MAGRPGPVRVAATALLLCQACATSTTFRTVPDGATLYLDGREAGATPHVHRDVSSLPRRYRVQVTHPGFHDEELFIDKHLSAPWFCLVAPATAGIGMFWAWFLDDEVVLRLRPLPPAPSPENPPPTSGAASP